MNQGIELRWERADIEQVGLAPLHTRHFCIWRPPRNGRHLVASRSEIAGQEPSYETTSTGHYRVDGHPALIKEAGHCGARGDTSEDQEFFYFASVRRRPDGDILQYQVQ